MMVFFLWLSNHREQIFNAPNWLSCFRRRSSGNKGKNLILKNEGGPQNEQSLRSWPRNTYHYTTTSWLNHQRPSKSSWVDLRLIYWLLAFWTPLQSRVSLRAGGQIWREMEGMDDDDDGPLAGKPVKLIWRKPDWKLIAQMKDEWFCPPQVQAEILCYPDFFFQFRRRYPNLNP